ncbi:TonB-dependent receptor domain-containing protein [Alishewanella sp. SMS8]|uniref:TonB-dependent receptor domain-containing protein n=1 Tax=Alishewanella sp. SMS8 TaxID=2994676 RepID=UPI0027425967|nr:TonB-dependent receptor [Alishewanella sp. SMS8]MDP5205876.1 TonB-dependent receptor [Alishewanella sp. SMS9]MDP5458748.1 TonB-dependent receptor [Alishewanella sp. SMS8]
MSSKQKLSLSRVGLSVMLALSTTTTLLPIHAKAQDSAPAPQTETEELERISVSGRLMSSAAAAAAERREQPYVAELLGMEQISRAGDSNAATALRRVTGLTLVKDKFIYVRGLGERYSSTLLNGALVPSPDPTRNVIPLDMFPAGIIESLVVQKAYSPELPAAFGGGNVNIRTAAIPLQTTFNVAVGTGYNSLNSADGFSYAGGGDDWHGKDDGTRAISSELAAAQNQFGVLTPINIAEALGGINATNLAQAQNIVRELGTAFNRDIDISRTSVKPDFDGSVSFGSRFDLAKNVVFGVMTGFSYDRATQNIEEQERYYSISGEALTPLNRYDDIRGTEHQIKLSGMLNFGLEFGVDHRIETSTIYLRDTKDEIKIKNGDSIETINETNRFNTDTSLTYEERTMLSNQLRGRHNLPSLWDLAIDWQYTDAKARRYAPGQVEYRYLNETQADGSVFSFLRRNQNAVTYSFGDMQDNTQNLSWNAHLPMTLGKAELTFSTGYNYFERNRDAQTDRFNFDTVGFSLQQLAGSFAEIFSDSHILDAGNGFKISNVTTQADDYLAAQMIDAGYAALELNYDYLFRLNLGVRYEDFKQVSLPLAADGQISGNVTDSVLVEDGFYPALSLTWFVNDDLQARFGYSKTVVRPDLREVTPVLYVDPLTDFKVTGFSGLTSTDINSADVRFEWYYDNSNYSVGLFYKDLDNPIEAIELSGSDGNLLMSFRNAESGKLYGVEAEFLQQLDMFNGSIGQIADNFFLAGNLTLSESEITIQRFPGANLTNLERGLSGHSKYVANLQLGFDSDNDKHNATLTYNVFGKRIAFAGVNGKDDAFEQPFNSLDVTYSYAPNSNISVKLGLKNLLDEDVEILQQGEILQKRTEGQSYSLSFSYKY